MKGRERRKEGVEIGTEKKRWKEVEGGKREKEVEWIKRKEGERERRGN